MWPPCSETFRDTPHTHTHRRQTYSLPRTLQLHPACISSLPLGCTQWRVFLVFLKDFIYLSLERGEGREKEEEWNINVWLPLVHPVLGTWPATQACALTGIRTSDALVCRPALNPLSHTSQGWWRVLMATFAFSCGEQVRIKQISFSLPSFYFCEVSFDTYCSLLPLCYYNYFSAFHAWEQFRTAQPSLRDATHK